MKLQRHEWVYKKAEKAEKVEKSNIKELKKKLKQIEKWVEDFSEKRWDSYWRDIEHNINTWCSIWEDSKKAKAYREQWNGIYKAMSNWFEE